MARYRTDINWGRRTPEERKLWGRFLYEQRWDHGRETQDSVRKRLDDLGAGLSETYYSDFETGKRVPNPEWQTVFRRLWNAEPVEEPVEEPPAASSDVAAAIDRQTDVMRELVEELRASRNEPPAWVDALVAALGASPAALGSAGSVEQRESDAPRPGR